MQWDIIETSLAPASEIMDKDARLLEDLSAHRRPILHFYQWERDSATYGYFTNPGNYLNLSRAEKRGLALAKRPTGGGIVFHVWDLAFSVLVPANCTFFSNN